MHNRMTQVQVIQNVHLFTFTTITRVQLLTYTVHVKCNIETMLLMQNISIGIQLPLYSVPCTVYTVNSLGLV